jgi:hypothetical protein
VRSENRTGRSWAHLFLAAAGTSTISRVSECVTLREARLAAAVCWGCVGVGGGHDQSTGEVVAADEGRL